MKLKILAIFCLFLVIPFFVEAKSYDFYVDDSASGDKNGSKESPFKKIGDAIDEAEEEGGKQEIYVRKGTYDEDVSLGKSMELYGKDEGSVKIIGTVTMRDGSSIKNLTIDGGNFAVVVKANADVEIENCTIEDFGKTGIHTEVGGGNLVVTGSKIRDGEGKGFYIQKGKDVVIVGNEVYDNGEEGIDIRSNVDGKIKNNIIRENGESGIELIVSKAELKITNNSIKYNGSSGIATQFYKELDKGGNIYISGNDIHSNVKYGLDCNTPQGGNPEKLYWSESIEMIGNNVSKNKLGTINSRCNFKVEKVIEVAEKGVAEIVEEETQNIEEKKRAEEDKLFEEENNRKIEEVRGLLLRQKNVIFNLKKSVSGIGSKGKIKLFLHGVNQKNTENSLLSLSNVKEDLVRTQNLLNEIHVSQEQEILFREEIEVKMSEVDKLINNLNQLKNSFPYGGWIQKFKNIFN